MITHKKHIELLPGDRIHVDMKNGKAHDLEVIAVGKNNIYGLDTSFCRLILPQNEIQSVNARS